MEVFLQTAVKVGAQSGAPRSERANADRTIEVPPGRYEVVLQGRPNIFLTGLTAKGQRPPDAT